MPKTYQPLVLPYFFSFRHYIELELKGFIVCISGEKADITHDLNSLYDTFLTSEIETLGKYITEIEKFTSLAKPYTSEDDD